MEPYQRASQAIRSGEENTVNLLKNAGLTALGGGIASIGAKGAASVLPAIGALINKYVPDNIMRAGLSKINPKFSTFMDGAIEAGYTMDDLRNYLGEKAQKSEKDLQNQKNIIQQESPELHTFLDQEIRKGINPIQAGDLALKDKRFVPTIKKLMKKYKTSWASIIQSIFGTGEGALSESGFPQNDAQRQLALNQFNARKKGVADQERERFERGYGQTNLGGQQGPGLQKFMSIMDKIDQQLGQ